MKTPHKSTKLKGKQLKFIELYVNKMGHITDVCSELKIDRGTYYLWLNNELFKEALDNAMEHFNDSVQRRILSLAMKDDKEMLKFWAKNQMKHRGWIEKQELNLTGSISSNIQVIIPKEVQELLNGEISSNQETSIRLSETS